jgi:hypothetical protein
MEKLQFTTYSDDFFCPITGYKLSGDDAHNTSPAVLACWSDVGDDALMTDNEELAKAWRAGDFGCSDEDIEAFLEGITLPEGAALFAVYGAHCIDWWLIDMGYFEEE